MKFAQAKKIAEGAYFIVDTIGYFNTITPFDLTLATQTISSVADEPQPIIEPQKEPLDEDKETAPQPQHDPKAFSTPLPKQ